MAIEPEIIDARGLKCPLPVLKLEKRLASGAPGKMLIVLATDPMAKVDIPLHCRQNGHDYALEEADGVMRFTVTRNR
ncbi:sulfurtransferase TusA family protein [Devosia sp. YIM 151766]|uniref:sulfurtransferase TusA family protein n=1 Tax=Devosia sp. YIM 151766 TaxID=3017325 RepID=UPI00255C52F5|nr:sulfurtransferase TusA family protein [Devosia sp. YIM 151766]WIY54238.1 sulfurtransferase TusA family protein [Devosia sp. YIM 151766]